eukprot:TRINITY_DN10525_c6_g2_i2.p2 TRINITY_DN10525_c6_g2~~TRINITY_DN10525_c6_g2_i2.p2  ORF type:complete len:126 (+),score=29.20 TRINITY_DN10525_c6_g2_i2:94-471(+)
MALKEKKQKMPPQDSQGVKKKKKKSNYNNYGRYILKVLKQIHPKMRISKIAMNVMESCVQDTFERIAGEASKLCRTGKAQTITTREIQSAVRLVIPGELSRHAVQEGCKAVMVYNGGGGEESQAP